MSRTKSWRGSTRSVFGTDLVERSLGVGDPTSADKSSGKNLAVWASVDLTGGGSVVGTVREYDLAHDLGKVPTLVTLETYENSTGPATITANGTRQENWSHAHVHVSVTLIAGSLDGCVARFLIRGR